MQTTLTTRFDIYWVEFEVLTGALSGLTVGEAIHKDADLDEIGYRAGDEFKDPFTKALKRVAKIVKVKTVEAGEAFAATREVRREYGKRL